MRVTWLVASVTSGKGALWEPKLLVEYTEHCKVYFHASFNVGPDGIFHARSDGCRISDMNDPRVSQGIVLSYVYEFYVILRAFEVDIRRAWSFVAV